MTQIAAKLARPDIAAPPSVDPTSLLAPTVSPSLPMVAIASIAAHGLVALALVGLPLPTSFTRELDATWVEFDFPAPAAAPVVVPEPIVIPEPEIAPQPIVHNSTASSTPPVGRDRPQPVVAPEPEVTPPPPEVIAPPSLEEAFAEPPPLAAALTTDGPGAFAVAPGELGGDPNGRPGGHGTSLVSTVRSAPQETGPSEADRRRARRGYVHAIEDLVRAHTRYPRAAARDGLQGRVELGLRVGSDGRVLAIRLATSSGFPILDDAALEAAHEIARVPAPPADAALCATDEVRVGVVYVVR